MGENGHFSKSVLSSFFLSVSWKTLNRTVQPCAKQCIVHKENSAFTTANDMKAALL